MSINFDRVPAVCSFSIVSIFNNYEIFNWIGFALVVCHIFVIERPLFIIFIQIIFSKNHFELDMNRIWMCVFLKAMRNSGR